MLTEKSVCMSKFTVTAEYPKDKALTLHVYCCFFLALRDSLRDPGIAIQSNKNNPEVIRFVNQADVYQNSALHMAVQTGHVSMCQVLLQHGAEVNGKNKCSRSPLQMASMGNNREILELLIKKGAQTNTKDRNHRTPLHR